ncbi:hypothetical protein OF83DRAFT_1088499 [Amylostereum chailletii]|nr:hypothetical protein OF83DRAFT_1088499 [Amylostereum chailletii]
MQGITRGRRHLKQCRGRECTHPHQNGRVRAWACPWAGICGTTIEDESIVGVVGGGGLPGGGEVAVVGVMEVAVAVAIDVGVYGVGEGSGSGGVGEVGGVEDAGDVGALVTGGEAVAVGGWRGCGHWAVALRAAALRATGVGIGARPSALGMTKLWALGVASALTLGVASALALGGDEGFAVGGDEAISAGGAEVIGTGGGNGHVGVEGDEVWVLRAAAKSLGSDEGVTRAWGVTKLSPVGETRVVVGAMGALVLRAKARLLKVMGVGIECGGEVIESGGKVDEDGGDDQAGSPTMMDVVVEDKELTWR